MALNIFKNKDDIKKENKKTRTPEKVEEVKTGEIKQNDKKESVQFSATPGSNAFRVLKNFYISEKASSGSANFNQYAFRVFNKATKPEIKKEVSKLFDVKVKSVKIVHMPKKRRDMGRHPGFKSGFKKAIVVLEKGHTIGQVR